ncbi:hypothetical protein KSP39_PZI011239 [Platanthera zijinensis]|uniref:Uncharacterized protein n=1 Tax=Platanthera zijinensis TaxID=2320716 RepID=A0AAP0BJN1_9ASPA
MHGLWGRRKAAAAAAAAEHCMAFSTATAGRAVMLPRFGGPEVLEVRSSVGVPDLKPQEVLVRARAVSVNPLDLRRGSCSLRIFGLISGAGQEVFGALHPTAVRGTYADYAILSEEELSVKPSSISHVDASAVPFAALTAWRALKCTARISKG